VNVVLDQGLKEIFVLEREGVAEGWTELYSEELHDLYWALNCAGLWTEREWDRQGKRNSLEKLKINTKFLFEKSKGKGNLGDLGLDEMLKALIWTAHKELLIQFPSAQ
jgi:hypothetical protein